MKDTEHYFFHSVALRSERFHHPECLSEAAMKNHISFVSVSGDRASTSLPRHNSPGQHPCASLSGPAAKPSATTSTSGSFITLTLAVPSSFTPATVILAGSSLLAGASHGGSRFLNYEPDISGRMGTQRERDIKRE